MSDSLLSGRHDGVISGNDDDSDIGHLSTTCTHGCESFVTRGIKESNAASIIELYVVSTDVLSDTACLSGNDIGLSDIVEERGLTMVNVSHHGNDRSTWHEIILVILSFLHSFLHLSADIFRCETELFSYDIDGFSVQSLIDTYHNTDRHECTDKLCDWNIHHSGKF